MILAVVGCGNVGANLLQHLSNATAISKILALDRDDDIVRAAIMDVAGAHPQFAHRIEIGDRSALTQADVIVLAAGSKSTHGQTPNDILRTNKIITDDIFAGVSLKPSAILITIPGPVEVLAMYLSRLLDHPARQVLGFGGDLDLNRLQYILTGRGASTQNANAIGEHGTRIIPVYETEESYSEVTQQVRNFLSAIDQFVGLKRNLATAPLLARLIHSILGDANAIHCVANPHPDYGLWLTWPFHINRRGADRMVVLELEPNADADLHALIEARRCEEIEMEEIFSL